VNGIHSVLHLQTYMSDSFIFFIFLHSLFIRCFDVASPGKDCFEIATSPSKKSPVGQKGMISCLSFNPDYSGAFAAGSFAHSVGVYVENMPECALLLSSLEYGVSCVRWSPCGRYLWTGGRNSSSLLCWDIRATQTVVGSVQRPLATNQRMTFDLDPWGATLCTGDQGGNILFFDTKTFELLHTVDSKTVESSSLDGNCQRRSCVNSVAFHPFSGLLGLSTGERTFGATSTSSGSSESDTDDSDAEGVAAPDIADDRGDADIQGPPAKKPRRTGTGTGTSTGAEQQQVVLPSCIDGARASVCASSIQLLCLQYTQIKMSTADPSAKAVSE
jgi:hypothetical protein